ncbi:hypothetical protein BDV06DRAFT_39112 [Aspergillus oleicola]
MTPIKNILVIGAGELGTPVLLALANHPNRTGKKSLSVLLRPSTISSPNPEKASELEVFKSNNISLVPGDIASSTPSTLRDIFKEYDTVISCTGFSAGPGTQLKLAKAVLEAKVSRYIPWQFGVDYDVIGRGSAQDLFDEVLDVRDLLRSQERTKWVVVSVGMFTSFLFEPSFGVVDFESNVVTALGGWDVRVSLTTPRDIGRVTAEVVLGYGVESDEGFCNEPIYVAGDTLSYGMLTELAESVTGRKFERRVRKVAAAKEDLAKNSGNGLFKYQIVFGEGKGVAWDVQETWNHKRGIKLQTAEEWARENLK